MTDKEKLLEYLEGGSIGKIELNHAKLKNAKLKFAKLQEADLGGANLRGADLSGADLDHANLSWANLKGANLSGAKLSHTNLYGVNLTSTILTNTNLSSSILMDAKIRRIDADQIIGNLYDYKIIDPGWDRFLTILKKIWTLINPTVDNYLSLASEKEFNIDFKGAIRNCTKAIALDPKSVSAYQYRAQLNKRMYNNEKAIKDYSKLIELDPKNASYYNQELRRMK